MTTAGSHFFPVRIFLTAVKRAERMIRPGEGAALQSLDFVHYVVIAIEETKLAFIEVFLEMHGDSVPRIGEIEVNSQRQQSPVCFNQSSDIHLHLIPEDRGPLVGGS